MYNKLHETKATVYTIISERAEGSWSWAERWRAAEDVRARRFVGYSRIKVIQYIYLSERKLKKRKTYLYEYGTIFDVQIFEWVFSARNVWGDAYGDTYVTLE